MRQIAFVAFDSALNLFGKILYGIYYLFGRRFILLIGKFIGDSIYLINRNLREMTKKEIAMLFGKRYEGVGLDNLTRKSIEHFYSRNLETFFLGVLNKERIKKILEVDGIENLEEALSRGKGVILLISHFGSFLLPLPFLGFQGYKVNQVTGKQLHRSTIEERIWAWRKREADKLPVKFIQVDKFLRPIYNALKNNEIIAIAFDGRDGLKLVPTIFFERTALFSAGPFELARRTGSTILPAFVIRKKDLTHRLVFEPLFGLSDDPDIERALRYDTRKFAELFSNYIERYPCHFGWLLFKIKKLQKAGISYNLFQDTE